MRTYFTIIILFIGQYIFSQDVYLHTSYSSPYNFLTEMANQGIIDINTSVMPFSRQFISKQLQNINAADSVLNNRQKKELTFLLKDFSKEKYTDKNFKKRLDAFYYRDSLFSFTMNPIGGIQYWSNKNGSWHHRWAGAEAYATIGKHWGFYANLRDNHESDVLNNPKYISERMGGNYKYTSDGGGDYSEMRGGITYAWDWGSFGLVKDHFIWGTNYHGSQIFSGRTPSFAQIKLNLKPAKWFEFNYVHGWLVSSVVDSVRSYWVNPTTRREVFHNKYLAANFFTFRPFERFYVSAGNSIVYSIDNVHPAFLIPVLFYKSVDHALNNTDKIGKNVGQNSQMFFDISSRQIKHLHLYASIFIDEIETGTMFDKDKQSNYFSYKAGFCLDGLGIRNLALNYEYTRTNPMVYKHDITTTTYTSNLYNLGHYLGDNSQEHYASVTFRPLRGLLIQSYYLHAEKGEDYPYIRSRDALKGLSFMDYRIWTDNAIGTKIRYEFINDGFVFFEYIYSNIEGEVELYTPQVLRGENNTISGGVYFGF
ncbi:MAG: hypothetical protein JXB49_05805 [Bacteroidales bacterium]|nr:hypothetical protein [Bacteroidales bacterium]